MCFDVCLVLIIKPEPYIIYAVLRRYCTRGMMEEQFNHFDKKAYEQNKKTYLLDNLKE